MESIPRYPRPDGLAPPPALSRLKELRLGSDMVRFAVTAPTLSRARRGDGRTALVVPGFKTSDRSLIPLRTFLGRWGHRAEPWRQGTNDGDIDRLLDATFARATELAERSGRPINLIGWSLGGVYVREVARDLPESVHRVVTMGTPLFGPHHTVGHTFYSEEQLEKIDAQIDERYRRPIERPIMAIWSRSDGIVDWRACRDDMSPDVRNLEVSSGHVGMGLDPGVWRTIADFLAE